jgi:hypothetical protein
MKKTLFVALAMLCIAINTTAQIVTTATARQYLPTAQAFTQGLIDSFNASVNYQSDIINGQALTYPDLQPISLTWNGMEWISATPVAITNAFTTPLMVGAITHTATATAGANNPNVVIDWADVPSVTQYRFRWRIVGGTWSASTVTGSQRTLTTLAYNTTYEVQVRVYINATTQGEYTNTYTFTTPQFVPLPPCNAPSVTGSISGNVMTLQWGAVSQAVGYQIEVRQLGALTWGGTTNPNTTYTMTVQPNTSYEYRVRTSCTGASSAWSTFTASDTLENAICTPPTGLYNVGNTFYWTPSQYTQRTQIQTRLVGTQNWGGTTVTGNSWSNPILWGQHEWRVRSVCYGTTNTGWTAWSSAITTNIPKPLSFEQFGNSEQLAYPNPASDVIKFKGRIVVQDLYGRVLLQGDNEIDVHQLADGLYIVNGKKHIVRH